MQDQRFNNRFRISHKILSIFLSSCLILSESLSYAQPISLNAPQKITDLNAIAVPEKFASVEETFFGNPQKMILYIQDAHDSLEAQKNIAKTIRYMVNQYGVRTVYEEGYEGVVPTDKYFGMIGNSRLRQRVSYFLLDKLRLSGAEYAHINRRKNFRLIGADSNKLHLANIEQYRRSVQNQMETKQNLDAFQQEIAKLASQYFPQELKEWIQIRERFDNNAMDLLDYLQRFKVLFFGSARSEEYQSHYPNIQLLLSVSDARNNRVAERIKGLDYRILFQEINQMEDDYARSQLTSETAERIFRYHKELQLLQRLNRIEISSVKFEAVKETLKNFRTEDLAKFIVQNTGKSIVLSKCWEQNIQGAIQFYEIAHLRDKAVKKSLEGFLADPKEGVSILVFGGFHKDGIKEILRRNRISYQILTPKIQTTDERHKAYYKQLMSIGRYPFEIPTNVRRGSRPESSMQRWDMLPFPLVRAELRGIEEIVQADEIVNLRSEIRSDVERASSDAVKKIQDLIKQLGESHQETVRVAAMGNLVKEGEKAMSLLLHEWAKHKSQAIEYEMLALVNAIGWQERPAGSLPRTSFSQMAPQNRWAPSSNLSIAPMQKLFLIICVALLMSVGQAILFFPFMPGDIFFSLMLSAMTVLITWPALVDFFISPRLAIKQFIAFIKPLPFLFLHSFGTTRLFKVKPFAWTPMKMIDIPLSKRDLIEKAINKILQNEPALVAELLRELGAQSDLFNAIVFWNSGIASRVPIVGLQGVYQELPIDKLVSLGGKYRYQISNANDKNGRILFNPTFDSQGLAKQISAELLKIQAQQKEVLEDVGELQVAVGFDTGNGRYANRGKFIALAMYVLSTDDNNFQALAHTPPVSRDPRSAYGLLIRGIHMQSNHPHQQRNHRLDYVFPISLNTSESNLNRLVSIVRALNIGLLLATAQDEWQDLYGKDALPPSFTPQKQAIADGYRVFERKLIQIFRRYDEYRNPEDIYNTGETQDHQERTYAFANYRLEQALEPGRKWVADIKDVEDEKDPDWDALLPYLRGIEGMILNNQYLEKRKAAVGEAFVRDVRELLVDSAGEIEDSLRAKEISQSPSAKISFKDPFIDSENPEATRAYATRMFQAVRQGIVPQDDLSHWDAIQYFGVEEQGDVGRSELRTVVSEVIRKSTFDPQMAPVKTPRKKPIKIPRPAEPPQRPEPPARPEKEPVRKPEPMPAGAERKTASQQLGIANVIKHSNAPAYIFVPYAEVRGVHLPLRAELFSVAYETQRSEVRFVVYGADMFDKDFRDLKNVKLTASGFDDAYKLFGARVKHRKSVLVSTDRSELRKHVPSLAQKRIDPFLLLKPGDAYVALLYAITDNPIPGIARDNDGFNTVIDEFLRSEIRQYQANLVVQMAA